MQLIRSGRAIGRRASVVGAFVAATHVTSGLARADKDGGAGAPAVAQKEVPTPPLATEAPSRSPAAFTKRVSLEMSAYTDTDNVTVFTPSVSATVENVTEGISVHGHYLVDVVSAASVDIVSTASGRWNEVRQAGGLEGTYKPRDTGITVASAVSDEPDYLAFSAGGQVTHDFNEKNSTLLLGYGYGHDTVGYHGTPFSVFSHTVQSSTISLALTQVVNRSTVASLAVEGAIETGDSSKPYRYIPLFSAAEAARVPNGASVAYVTAARLPERPTEQLPLNRQRYSASGRLAHRFDGSTLRAEERVYVDSWLLLASSTDLRWIFGISRRVQLWPHLRVHAQNEVSFWRRAYVSESSSLFVLPALRTGDRELGPLVTETAGGGLKVFLGDAGAVKQLSIAAHLDASYTSYLDDLYITARGSVLGALILEGEL
jgi:hypothetical protein